MAIVERGAGVRLAPGSKRAPQTRRGRQADGAVKEPGEVGPVDPLTEVIEGAASIVANAAADREREGPGAEIGAKRGRVGERCGHCLLAWPHQDRPERDDEDTQEKRCRRRGPGDGGHAEGGHRHAEGQARRRGEPARGEPRQRIAKEYGDRGVHAVEPGDDAGGAGDGPASERQ